MARYPLNLPTQLKQEAERWAADQGVSLNQFIMWAVAEKVTSLGRGLDDPSFPRITYRRGSSGRPVAVVRGTGIRVQTLALGSRLWRLKPAELAREYGLARPQVDEALAFYEKHRGEIDAAIAAEERMEDRARA